MFRSLAVSITNFRATIIRWLSFALTFLIPRHLGHPLRPTAVVRYPQTILATCRPSIAPLSAPAGSARRWRATLKDPTLAIRMPYRPRARSEMTGMQDIGTSHSRRDISQQALPSTTYVGDEAPAANTILGALGLQCEQANGHGKQQSCLCSLTAPACFPECCKILTATAACVVLFTLSLSAINGEPQSYTTAAVSAAIGQDSRMLSGVLIRLCSLQSRAERCLPSLHDKSSCRLPAVSQPQLNLGLHHRTRETRPQATPRFHTLLSSRFAGLAV